MASMKRCALIAEHDVVSAWHTHDEIDTGRHQKREQHIHVVLIGFCMIGITDIAAHRHTEQLTAEMVFEPGPDDLLAVEQVLGADETDDGVDQKWLESPRYRVGSRLQCLLIHAVMCVR